MKFTTVAALTALAASVCAAPGFTAKQFKKYHCLTLENYLTWVPPCSINCLKLGLDGGRDKCAPDDMVCHCQHTQRIDDILVPCILDPTNVNATCGTDEINTLQGIVTDLCTFYNATSYLDYIGCSPKVTLEIIQEATGKYN